MHVKQKWKLARIKIYLIFFSFIFSVLRDLSDMASDGISMEVQIVNQ